MFTYLIIYFIKDRLDLLVCPAYRLEMLCLTIVKKAHLEEFIIFLEVELVQEENEEKPVLEELQ
jgi:hypothetical protein